MTIGDINALYEEKIAPLSGRDRLLLASTILARLADSAPRELSKEEEEEILRRQRIALESIHGIAGNGSLDDSLKHDEIIYGYAKP